MSSSNPFVAPSAPDSTRREPARASIATNGLKILVANDSAVAITILSSTLRLAGYEVVTARDGIEAAQAVYRERPDVVLLDIFMPRMNGYQVCRLIKQDPAVAGIPVLINTASEGRSFGVCTPGPTAS